MLTVRLVASVVLDAAGLALDVTIDVLDEVRHKVDSMNARVWDRVLERIGDADHMTER